MNNIKIATELVKLAKDLLSIGTDNKALLNTVKKHMKKYVKDINKPGIRKSGDYGYSYTWVLSDDLDWSKQESTAFWKKIQGLDPLINSSFGGNNTYTVVIKNDSESDKRRPQWIKNLDYKPNKSINKNKIRRPSR